MTSFHPCMHIITITTIQVGNGFIASIVDFSSMHVSGFFNGGCGSVTKAHLPSVSGITVTNAIKNLTQAALDMGNGMFVRRLHIPVTATAVVDAAAAEPAADPAAAPPTMVVVEQRIFAHRVRMNVMVTEFEIVDDGGEEEVTLELSTLFDPLCGPLPPPPPAPPSPVWYVAQE